MPAPRVLATVAPSPYDPRDYPFVPDATIVVPADNDRRWMCSPVRNQGQEGACVAFGTAAAAESFGWAGGDRTVLSTAYAYSWAQQASGTSGVDGGADLRAALQIQRKRGICPESLMPFNDAVDWVATDNPVLDAAAATRTLARYTRIDEKQNWQDIIAQLDNALAQPNKRVVVAMAVREGIRHLSGPIDDQQGKIAGIPAYMQEIGYHCMEMCGSVSRNGGLYYFKQSWGTDYGDAGFISMSKTCVSDMIEIFVLEGFAGFPFTPEQEMVSSLYAALFGRAPEAGGLAYWTPQLAASGPVGVAQNMFMCDPARAYYPAGMSAANIAHAFYTNVLGRAPDADGLAYWTNQLIAKQPGRVIVDLIQSVAAYAGTDPDALASQQLLANKRIVGLDAAITVGINDVARCQRAFAGLSGDLPSLTTAKVALRA